MAWNRPLSLGRSAGGAGRDASRATRRRDAAWRLTTRTLAWSGLLMALACAEPRTLEPEPATAPDGGETSTVLAPATDAAPCGTGEMAPLPGATSGEATDARQDAPPSRTPAVGRLDRSEARSPAPAESAAAAVDLLAGGVAPCGSGEGPSPAPDDAAAAPPAGPASR